jgi:two-component system osmolarity sensor histidine kinase EnvZ
MPVFSIKRYLPRSLYGRAALILLVPIITLQLVVSIGFVQRLYEDVTEQMTQNISIELALLLDEVNAGTEPSEIAGNLSMTAEYSDDQMRDRRRFYDLSGKVIYRILRENFDTVEAIDLVQDRKSVQLIMQSDRGPLFIEFSRRRVAAANPHQLIVLMVFTGALMTLIAYLFLRNQLRPIRRLARAAEAFGKGRHETYYPGGANEVRSAGTAFLNMRARIERQIEQRTLMLSGVSHDLRTPLTRLKLGLSMQEETPETKALIGDVDEMEQLIAAFLDFARADATEELEAIDPKELLNSVVVDAIRSGRNVVLGPMGEVKKLVKLRPMAIRRALENLIGNAVRYGDEALVTLDVLDKTIRIKVEDNGPGIPADLRDEALKPFARLDNARNQNKGSGVGLGLAIAADITRSHGGSLRLGDSAELGGLSAEIVLPL